MGGLDLFQGVGGTTDEGLGAQDLAGAFRREAVGREVDTIRVGGEGDVGAPVDDEQGAARDGFAQALGERQEVAGHEGFLAELDDSDAAGHGLADGFGQVRG